MSDGCRQHGDITYVHFDMPGGATEQRKFLPGLNLQTAMDLYPGAKARPMTPAEIEAWRKSRDRETRNQIKYENEGFA